MSDTDSITKECNTFTRYLISSPADEFIQKKYIEAFSYENVREKINHKHQNSTFDKLLLKLARIDPVLTRATDVFSRFYYKDSGVRKRLVLLLAILESWGPAYKQLDELKSDSNLLLVATGLIFEGLSMGVLLLFTSITLLPLKIVLRISSNNQNTAR